MRLRQESRLAAERVSMELQAEISQRIRWSVQHQPVCEDIWVFCHLAWMLHVTGNSSSWDVSDKDLHEEMQRSDISLTEIRFLLNKRKRVELQSSKRGFVCLFVGQMCL